MKRSIELQFEYKNIDNCINKIVFFEEEGNLVFDTESKNQMEIMMNEICDKLKLESDYLIKKLEFMLKYELPFFATNRRLARNWMLDNFIF
ncbi:MAG: hypothetical protein JJV95_05840 [Sulfurospirillum sp.]|nr:hypothetical protein [Sulfurospirillum sp.]MBL0703486.1 hypothetical protein [Sulfurospirillum sp.]